MKSITLVVLFFGMICLQSCENNSVTGTVAPDPRDTIVSLFETGTEISMNSYAGEGFAVHVVFGFHIATYSYGHNNNVFKSITICTWQCGEETHATRSGSFQTRFINIQKSGGGSFSSTWFYVKGGEVIEFRQIDFSNSALLKSISTDCVILKISNSDLESYLYLNTSTGVMHTFNKVRGTWQ